MGVDSEKLNRAIASFNNQITRITKIRDLYPVGNKVRENLEGLIKKLIEDRDTLTHTLSHTTDSFLKNQDKTEKVGIKENVEAVLGRSDKVEQVTNGELKRIILENSMSKTMTFLISLGASIVALIIGIVIGKFFL